jgi:hypothetical protein
MRCWQISRYLQDWSRKLASNYRYFSYSPDTAHGFLDPGKGWDAIVVGEYERAFYGSQYALMAPLFEHYGVQLWMPEVGGRVSCCRR